MICLEVRHSLDSDPAHKTGEIENHLKGCSVCTDYAHKINRFEKSLSNALHINVPEGLPHRILLTQNINAHRDIKQGRLRLYGIAASILLAIGLASGLLLFKYPYSLEQIALQHVQNELHHLYDKKNVQLAALNNMLSPLNIRFNNAIGTINYAGTCNIRNNRGGHLVLQGDNAPVTLLLMPGKYVSHQEIVNGSRFKGIILPIENGSVAIISENKKDLETFVKKIKQSLRVI